MMVKKKRERRGMTVIAVLICLIVVILLGGAMLKVGLAQRAVARDHQDRLQAEWLAESGANRALARLSGDPGYKGETWSLSRAELGLDTPAPAGGSPSAAAVVIAVDRPASSAASRRVSVHAEYRPSANRQVRHTKQILIELDNQ
jgi:type II secretory pathway pseudopilin PulG